ncbi:hypothetical protein Gotur_031237 [Gossypium turneri]
MCITGMSKQWKRVDIFTLSIYSLFIFPKALGHVGEAVIDLFDRLDKGVTQVPAILAETFSLQEDDVEWKARWMVPDEILYRCGDFYWIPLLGIWGAVRYTPLLVLR